MYDALWAVLVAACDELGAVDWRWQSADAMLGKARGVPERGAVEAGVGPNPTDRGKAGTKKSVLVGASGGPLSVVCAGANVHDCKLLEATLEAVILARPDPLLEPVQNLCMDKGYDNPTAEEALASHHYTGHIRRIGEEKRDPQGERRYPAGRWVVERTLAWLSRWRGILIRWEKKAENYLGTLKLACALLWFRRWARLVVTSEPR